VTEPLISTRPNGTIRSRRAKGAREFQHTIGGLLTKRSHVVQTLREAEFALADAQADVAAIDRALKLVGFKDDPRPYMPKRKNRRIFKKGEMLSGAYAVLREADGPLSSREICLKLLSDKGLEALDKKTVNQVTSRVHKALMGEQEAGRVVSQQHAGKALVWGSK